MSDSIQRATLDNGLRVVAQRVHGIPGVGVAVHYRVGFRSEPRMRSGFAHLFEHMMFQGSLNVRRGEHFERIQEHGGQVNGHTFPDHTDYYQVVSAGMLADVLAMEADRMAGLAITRENLDTQRDVVKQEIRLQVEGRPYGGFPWTTLPAVQFRKWENTHNGYGDIADLEAATAEECADFYARHYAPGNAVLALCGDLAPAAAIDAARRAFRSVPARPVPAAVDVSEPWPTRERRGTAHDPLIPRPALAIGWRLPDPGVSLADYAAFVVLSHLLTSGASARLRQALAAHDTVVDTSVGLFGPLMVRDPDTFVAVAHHPEGAADAVLRTIEGEVRQIGERGAGVDESRRAVANALTRQYLQLDSLAYRVRALARGELLFRQPLIADRLARHIAEVGPALISRAAGRLTRGHERAVLHLRQSPVRQPPPQQLHPQQPKETAA
ncbi:pitrilysin family protein [Streptomyces sp. NPDC045431]|uniref:M16 family metallopeptidase n=1 Tax=Streptomyces sp. NPDC045431 TaxID=3155613 RepID=UPI0033E563D7